MRRPMYQATDCIERAEVRASGFLVTPGVELI